MDESDNQTPWELVIANCLAEVLTSDVSDKTKELRISALNTIRAQVYAYQGFGIIQRLLTAIAEKKCKFLMEITSKTEMTQMLKPRCPTYNGNEFIPDKYHILEEELIGWSQASLEAPLNDAGFKRYMEVFKSVLPDLYPFIGMGGAQ